MIETIRKLVSLHGRLSISIDSLGNQDCLWSKGLQSFAAVQLLIAVEETFDVEFDVLNGSTLESIGTIAKNVASLLNLEVENA